MWAFFKDSQRSTATNSAVTSIDCTRLPSKAKVAKVVCGADYAAALLEDGTVFSSLIVPKQASTSQKSPSDAVLPAMVPVGRLKGVTVVDIAATAVSIIAVTADRKIYTVSTIHYQHSPTQCTIPLRFKVIRDEAEEARFLKRAAQHPYWYFGLQPPRTEVIADSALGSINLYSHPYQGLGAATETSGDQDTCYNARIRHCAFPSLQAAAGALFFMVACREAGVVFAGGINQSGQLGIGSDDEALEVAEGDLKEVCFAPPLKHPVWRIRCGGCHTVALVPAVSDASAVHTTRIEECDNSAVSYECDVYVWGRNANGQLGLPLSTEKVNRPTKLQGVTAIDASCGDYSTVLLSKRNGGSIGVCGKNTAGQLGVAVQKGEEACSLSRAVTPIQWFLLSTIHHSLASASQPWLHVSSIACGGGFGVGHTILTLWGAEGEGIIMAAGSNKWGQLGLHDAGTEVTHFTKINLPQADGHGELLASAGWMHSIVWAPQELLKATRTIINKFSNSALELLPPEARNHIIEFLPAKDALVVSLVSSLWHEHVRHCGALWAGTLQRRYPISAERLQAELAAEKALRGGYLAYGEGVDYVQTLSRLTKERYGRITSHPDDDTKFTPKASSGFLSTLSSLFQFGRGKSDHRILMVGLDAAGKTTILYTLKVGELVTTIPTIGFNVETVEYKNINFTCWDVGGPDKLRALWRHYYENVSAIIFVVDSSDLDRLPDATKQLTDMTREQLLMDKPILVVANKQDLPSAMALEQVAAAMRGPLNQGGRRWCVQGASASQKIGIYDGLDWLSKVLTEKKSDPAKDAASQSSQ